MNILLHALIGLGLLLGFAGCYILIADDGTASAKAAYRLLYLGFMIIALIIGICTGTGIIHFKIP